jgi:putative oxidoreductase
MLKFFGNYRDYASLAIRIMLGLTLFLSHGLPKITSPDRWQGEGEAMAHLGITFAPVFWGFMAGATETLAGLLFLIGLAVRPAALTMVFVMLVAALAQIERTGALRGGAAHPVDFAAGAVALVLLGAGAYSLDRKFGFDK